jgi:hypothetical protein
MRRAWQACAVAVAVAALVLLSGAATVSSSELVVVPTEPAALEVPRHLQKQQQDSSSSASSSPPSLDGGGGGGGASTKLLLLPDPDLELLTSEQVQLFLKQGYLRLRTRLSRGFNAALFKQLRHLHRDEYNPGNNVLPRIDKLQAVLKDGRVRGALTSVLGPGYVLHPHRHAHESFPGKEKQPLHQDTYFDYLQRRHHAPQWAMLFYYPQDTRLELGPTTVVNGSHFDHVDQPHEARREPLLVSAGDFVLLHYNLWHGGAANTLGELLPGTQWRNTKDLLFTNRVSSVPSDPSVYRYMIKLQFVRVAQPGVAGPTWNYQPPALPSGGGGGSDGRGGGSGAAAVAAALGSDRAGGNARGGGDGEAPVVTSAAVDALEAQHAQRQLEQQKQQQLEPPEQPRLSHDGGRGGSGGGEQSAVAGEEGHCTGPCEVQDEDSLGDGMCDDEANNCRCDWDRGDCAGVEEYGAPSGYSVEVGIEAAGAGGSGSSRGNGGGGDDGAVGDDDDDCSLEKLLDGAALQGHLWQWLSGGAVAMSETGSSAPPCRSATHSAQLLRQHLGVLAATLADKAKVRVSAVLS